MTLARGIHFTTLGSSVARDPPPALKRLELLPEEALYLVERGSMFCWKDIGGDQPGAPMSVQQAYAEMVGREGVTLEHYQVRPSRKKEGNTDRVVGVRVSKAVGVQRPAHATACSTRSSIVVASTFHDYLRLLLTNITSCTP